MTKTEAALTVTMIDIRQKMLKALQGSVIGSIPCQTRVVSSHSTIYLGNDPRYKIVVLGDNTVKLYNAMLDRSPETREIKKEIERFLKEYLPEIEVKYVGKCLAKKRSDFDLIKNNKLGRRDFASFSRYGEISEIPQELIVESYRRSYDTYTMDMSNFYR